MDHKKNKPVIKQRKYAYADIFLHPEIGETAFDDNGIIKPGINPKIAGVCKNESNCTVFLKDGTWFTTWGQGSNEHSLDEKIVFSTSNDFGRTWTEPGTIIESSSDRMERNSYGIPFVVPDTDRIYLFFFTVSRTEWPLKESGMMFFVYSDDRGASWSQKYLVELPERNIQVFPGRVHGWVNHPPKLMPNGEVIFTYSSERARHPDHFKYWDWRLNAAEVNVVKCVNILSESNPLKLHFETFPKGGYGIRVNLRDNWDKLPLQRMVMRFGGREEELGFSIQELTVTALPSGRWIGVGRSYLGAVVFTESFDQGINWSPAEPLRYHPGGEFIKHPMTMCPIESTSDGRVVLLFTNNDGSQNGAEHVWDGNGKTRNPQWMAVGKELPGLQENGALIFGSPQIIVEVDNSTECNLKTGISMPQFFERDGRYFVCYNINKEHIMLDEIPASLLDKISP